MNWLVNCLKFIAHFKRDHVQLVVPCIVVVGYLLGSIPSGLLISFSRGIDIRKHGSGNIGATNVWRTMGKTWGLIAFSCDFLKGWLAVYTGVGIAANHAVIVHLPQFVRVTILFPPDWPTSDYAGIAGAVGCILGHNFPVWLRFKGGKGVATSLGVIFGMMPLVAIVVLAIWGFVLKASRYVSLASLTGALSLPVVVIALLFLPWRGWGAVNGWGNFYFAVAAALLVFIRHAPNIRRLINGEELRFGTSKPTENSASDARPLENASQPPADDKIFELGIRARKFLIENADQLPPGVKAIDPSPEPGAKMQDPTQQP